MERVRSSKLRLRMTGTVKERLSRMRRITTYDASMGNGVHHRRRRMIGTSGTETHLDRHLISDSKTSRKLRQRKKDVTLEGAAILVRQGSPSPDGEHQRNSPKRERHRHRIKAEKYDGNGCVETYLMNFSSIARYNDWDPVDKAAHLRAALTGSAARLFWSQEEVTYDELTAKLRLRFGSKE